MCSRVAATSFSPSGEPCESWLSALFGEPLPMMVLQQIRLGRSVTALACSTAAFTASKL